MGIKAWIGLSMIIFSSNVLKSNCDPSDLVARINQSGILTIGQNYTSLKRLSYGEKCSIDLEERAATIGDSVLPIVSKLLPIAVALQSGNEFEITESLIVEIEESLVPIKDFTANVTNSAAGGLCNTTKYLYCDKTFGECRCGKSVKPKGYSYTIDNSINECRFDLGSGCLPPELESLALKCRSGTHCVTPIENIHCDTESMILENLNHPLLSRNIALQKGYVCFCDKNITTVGSSPNNFNDS